MTGKLKVYGWQGWRTGVSCYQTREICAAPSKAALYRITGNRPSEHFNLAVTGNAHEIRMALAYHGVVLWRGLDDAPQTWYQR